MSTIDFITFITKHSLEYAKFLRLTGETLKSGHHDINWKCVLSNGAKIVPDNFECINKISFKKSLKASMRHGLTVNSALPKIVSDYVIISDVDIAMTYKDWDDIIIKVLDSGYSCFGTENIRKEREPAHFPSVPFFCFKKEIMKTVNLDFTPKMRNGQIKSCILKTKEAADFSGREIGERVIYNTGSRLYKSFKKLGLKGKNLPAILVRSEDVQLKFSSLKERDDILKDKKISNRNLSEFHYDGEVFLTHLGRSHKRNFSVGYVRNWSNRIKKHVSKKYGINIAF